MSRSILNIILGVLILMGLTVVALLLFQLGTFTISSSTTTVVTPTLPDPISGGTQDINMAPSLTATVGITATTAVEIPRSSPTAVSSASEISHSSPTAVPPAVNTTEPSPVPIVQPTATAVPTSCIDKATLITDVTIPDGTQVAPGTGFNKIWRLLNNGTCTWENNYKIVHAGGPLLGAMATEFPLNATVYPGEFYDLTLNMVSPEVPGTYQSDWRLQNTQGQSFGVGAGNSPLWVKIVVTNTPDTTITGLIYQDVNENGIYELGEPVVAGREIRLVPSTSCVAEGEIVGTALSDANGRYTLSGQFNGSYCVGLVGEAGFEDGVNVDLTAGQVLTQFNFRAPNPNASISGYLWNDYCLSDENGFAVEGDCVPDGQGGAHADGMIQATETYIPDVTVFLQPGNCPNNVHLPVPTSTGANGQYVFTKLDPGTYCISIDATWGGNGVILMAGNWTYPGWGIWYQEINLQENETVSSVNFGWDYEP